MHKRLEKLLLQLSQQQACNEGQVVESLSAYVREKRTDIGRMRAQARDRIEWSREHLDAAGMEAFFRHYGLHTEEGVSILSLAEALLRIPDARTANALIHDKVMHGHWRKKGNAQSSALMQLSSFGMALAKKMVAKEALASRLADPILRRSIRQSMMFLGNHFVLGEDMESALHHAQSYRDDGFMFSFDMLGEGARSEAQAAAYLARYLHAVDAVGRTADGSKLLMRRDGISVKLSALHPRFELMNKGEVMVQLAMRIKQIALKAMQAGVPMTIDAEESRRLDMTLELFTYLMEDKDLASYEGLGLAVQAYHRHAHMVIDYIAQLGRHTGRRIPVRLVKGAYWDSEIKYAQVHGHSDYPVFTRKSHTDISYLACAYTMVESPHIFPQFATHNAFTASEIEAMVKGKDYEFQCLHGMGKSLYTQLVAKHPCRVYAPVGEYRELLPYLIRRLLENSANSSFVNLLADPVVPASQLLADPLEHIDASVPFPLPGALFPDRKNSSAVCLGNRFALEELLEALQGFVGKEWQAGPIIGGRESGGGHVVVAPYDTKKKIGKVAEATIAQMKQAMDVASQSHMEWDTTPVEERAAILERMADLLEENRTEAVALAVQEAGKTIPDALAEVREAVDFCRYYAVQAKQLLGEVQLPGPTGERNVLSLHGRGVWVAISPWNFPLAIFTGQVAAALVTGNCVVAKPAEQTPMMAAFATRLFHKAGVPGAVLNLVPGSGEMTGKHLLTDPRVAGVVFTGSVETARIINQTLSQRTGAIVPLIAETGGLNAMIADSSAHIEQTVDDVVTSAFGSAGQRCSACRVLYVQEDMADDFLLVLEGALHSLQVGSPAQLNTDVGPVIDREAYDKIKAHIKHFSLDNRVLSATPLDAARTEAGHFVAPHVLRLDSLRDLGSEVFGPVLHVVRYRAKELDEVLAEINDSGYGLTLGIQTRIVSRAEYIRQAVKVGNVYVNRSMIGAVVGVQPFGGEGLSGTGPKAGGPHYLSRFVVERTYTVNTTAIGGNRELLV